MFLLYRRSWILKLKMNFRMSDFFIDRCRLFRVVFSFFILVQVFDVKGSDIGNEPDHSCDIHVQKHGINVGSYSLEGYKIGSRCILLSDFFLKTRYEKLFASKKKSMEMDSSCYSFGVQKMLGNYFGEAFRVGLSMNYLPSSSVCKMSSSEISQAKYGAVVHYSLSGKWGEGKVAYKTSWEPISTHRDSASKCQSLTSQYQFKKKMNENLNFNLIPTISFQKVDYKRKSDVGLFPWFKGNINLRLNNFICLHLDVYYFNQGIPLQSGLFRTISSPYLLEYKKLRANASVKNIYNKSVFLLGLGLDFKI